MLDAVVMERSARVAGQRRVAGDSTDGEVVPEVVSFRLELDGIGYKAVVYFAVEDSASR